MNKMEISIEELDIHLTNRCMLSCRHCCFHGGRRVLKELPLRRWLRIIEEGKEIGVKSLDITGGEPLLVNNIETLIKAAVDSEYDVTLQTNGLLLDHRARKKLKNHGLEKIMVSMDGWETSHNWLRGKEIFNTVKLHVEQALEEGWQVRVNAAAMRSTAASIPRLLEWAIESRVHTVSIFYFSPQGRGADLAAEELEYHEWERFITAARERVQANNPPANSPTKIIVEPAWAPLKGLVKPLRCPILSRGYLQVLCDGRAYPCTMLIFTGLHVGDLSRESLRNCIEETRWQRFRTNNNTRCDIHRDNRCLGGCIGYNAYRTGALGADPRCRQAPEGAFPVCPLLKLDLLKNKQALRSGFLVENNGGKQ